MNQTPEVKTRTEIRDGMRITWHQPIEMDDGLVLRADVYRPIADGRYPVILSYGVYAKGLAYQDGYPMQWEKMVADNALVTYQLFPANVVAFHSKRVDGNFQTLYAGPSAQFLDWTAFRVKKT